MIALGATDFVVLNPRRGSADLNTSPTSGSSAISGTATAPVSTADAGARPQTPNTAPVRGGRPGLAEKNQRLKNALDMITTAPESERIQRATDTASHVMTLDDEQLAARTPEENVQALAILTSVNQRITVLPNSYREEVPAPQMAALAKLYENMQLDPDFEQHDGAQRDAILTSIANDPAAQNLSEVDWVPNFRGESDKDSQSRLRRLQSLQTAHMPQGMIGADDTLVLKRRIGDGSSGVCNGKKVSVSADTTKNNSFDETLNTVVHETTHAYQNHLTEMTDTMALDDPRYVQAQMFKFNAKGYSGPPPALGANPTVEQTAENERLYKAYKNQPMERHAWQAGNEAGRLFDATAGALAAVETATSVRRFSPDSGDEAAGLAEQIRTGNNQQRAACMLDLDVLAEQALGRAAKAISVKLADGDCLGFIGALSWNGFESRRVDVLNDHKAKPAHRLKTLETVKNELDKAYKDGQALEAVKAEIVTVSDAILDRLQPAEISRWLGQTRRKDIDADRRRLADSRTDPAARLKQLQKMRDDLGPEIDRARVAFEQALAREAQQQLKSRIISTNTRIVTLLESNDMTLLPTSKFDVVNGERKRLVGDQVDAGKCVTEIEQLEAELTQALRSAKQVQRDIVVEANAIVDLMKPGGAVEALGGATAWNAARDRRVELLDGKEDAAQRLIQLKQLRTEIAQTLEKAKLAEMAAGIEFTRLWDILTIQALPEAVHRVAGVVRAMTPRTLAVSTLKESPAVIDYFKEKGQIL